MFGNSYCIISITYLYKELPWWFRGKESTCTAGDMENIGFIPGWGRSPEERMATHSSIPAWEIPWTEEPGELQSTGLQRVGHH